MFISPRGEFVAVTSGNHVTILRKDDDYRKPCGSFTGYLSFASQMRLLFFPFKFGLWIHLLWSLRLFQSYSAPQTCFPHYDSFICFCFHNHPSFNILTMVLWLLFSVSARISGSFTSGIWSENHDVLGLVDDSETLFFIKANGEEISQVTKRNLKVSSSVLGLIENEDGLQTSCLYVSFFCLYIRNMLFDLDFRSTGILMCHSAPLYSCLLKPCQWY